MTTAKTLAEQQCASLQTAITDVRNTNQTLAGALAEARQERDACRQERDEYKETACLVSDVRLDLAKCNAQQIPAGAYDADTRKNQSSPVRPVAILILARSATAHTCSKFRIGHVISAKGCEKVFVGVEAFTRAGQHLRQIGAYEFC
jgi:hypothetical protein